MDLCIEPGQSLGLMIRGGLEYNLGIYITGVDKDSVADRAGLMVTYIIKYLCAFCWVVYIYYVFVLESHFFEQAYGVFHI